MKTIDQLSRKTMFSYCLTLVLLCLSPVIGHLLSQTIRIENLSETGITLQSVSIIILLVFTPLGLKLFERNIKGLQNIEDINVKLIKYFRYFNVRLIMVAIPLFVNVILYYVIKIDSMIFCAGISAVALVFCKPDKNKLLKELNLEEQS